MSRRHRPLHRRKFLGLLAAFAVAAAAPARRVRLRPRFPGYPFSLGVASGDPAPDGMVLWTRLAPDPLRGGGMPGEVVRVAWEVADDEGFQRILRQGTAAATPQLGHTVHVELDGLDPDRWYFYRFHAGAEVSPVGRTRTAPPATARPDRLRFAFASCQHYEQGYYTAYRHMAAESLDLVVHLGDYIYEYAGQLDRIRMHTGNEIETLEDYRNRYALYKSDPDLIAAHAAFPWIVTWDDHEVDNNYAAEISERRDPVDAFLRRRANAYQAYYEHMPLRRASLPRGPDLTLHRRVHFGGTATFHVLDTRQYRTDQQCGDRNGPPCDGVFDPAATLLGAEQEAWLFEGLRESRSRWNVLAQQVMVAPVDHAPGEGVVVSMDQWSGYDAARQRLTGFLRERRPSNPVVITGDIHSNWVNDVKADFGNPDSPVVATEFVGTSISSGGDGRDQSEHTPAMLAENPFVKYYNGQRGYVRCEVTADAWRSDYRVLDYVSQPGSPMGTKTSFVVEEGRPGAQAD
jgi:alkaline phosphatase D